MICSVCVQYTVVGPLLEPQKVFGVSLPSPNLLYNLSRVLFLFFAIVINEIELN